MRRLFSREFDECKPGGGCRELLIGCARASELLPQVDQTRADHLGRQSQLSLGDREQAFLADGPGSQIIGSGGDLHACRYNTPSAACGANVRASDRFEVSFWGPDDDDAARREAERTDVPNQPGERLRCQVLDDGRRRPHGQPGLLPG